MAAKISRRQRDFSAAPAKGIAPPTCIPTHVCTLTCNSALLVLISPISNGISSFQRDTASDVNQHCFLLIGLERRSIAWIRTFFFCSLRNPLSCHYSECFFTVFLSNFFFIYYPFFFLVMFVVTPFPEFTSVATRNGK